MLRSRQFLSLVVCLGIGALILTSCGSDDGNGPTGPGPFNAIKLNIFEPDALNSGFVFHLWAMSTTGENLSAEAVEWSSLATFRLVPQGAEATASVVTIGGAPVTNNTLTGLNVDWEDVDSVYITIEPTASSPATPQGPVYLVAKVPDNLLVQTIGGAQSQVNTNNVAGQFALVTPTDADPNNDTSGVWFISPSVPPASGLTLNTLPAGWRYEGWAWHGGTWLSTGTFTDPEGPDAANPYSALTNPPLAFPGEDFLTNNVNLPWVFVGDDSVMVTVEPNPDTDIHTPFGFRLLSRALPDQPGVGIVHGLFAGDDEQYIPGGNVVFQRSDE